MNRIIFVLISLAIEILAVLSVIICRNYFLSVSIFMVLHALSAISLAYASYTAMPIRYKKDYREFLLFCFLFFFILSAEFIAFLLLDFVLKRTSLEKSGVLHINPELEIGHKIISVAGRQYGEGSVLSRLTGANVPVALQQSSLLYLINKSPALSYKFVKQSLYNPQDEIRLLAFGLLSNIEKEINNKIAELKKYLDGAAINSAGEIYLDIAKLYWESVDKNISDNEFESYNLSRSKDYALMSINENYKNFETMLLLGKVCLRLKDAEQAQNYFCKSLSFECFKDKAVPYLAEIYFTNKKFMETKKMFKEIKTRTLNNRLNNIIEIWKH